MENFNEENINDFLSKNDLLNNAFSITGKKVIYLLLEKPRKISDLSNIIGKGERTIYIQLAILKNELLIKKEKKIIMLT